MSLGMEFGLGLRDIVFDVDPATPRKKGTPTPTQFLAHVYCGQMAGWMKTPLGTEVDLGSGHTVLDGVPAPEKGAQHPPLFGPCLLWPRSPISATAELLFTKLTDGEFRYFFLLKLRDMSQTCLIFEFYQRMFNRRVLLW